MRAVRVAFVGAGEVELEEFDPGEPASDELLVEAECSLISAGTELTVLHRRFEEGTHWDAWVRYPFHPGYALIGRVVAVGAEAGAFKLGARVACRASHASVQTVKAARVVLVPDDVPAEDATWFALGKITLHAALAGPFTVGASIGIVGAGPIGQLVARWGRLSGPRSLAVVDPVESRLAFLDGVADDVLAVSSGEAPERFESLGLEFPEIVVDATGAAPVVSDALRLCADGGTVVLLGDTGFPSAQRLTGDLLRRGIRLVGVHDSHVVGRWTNATMSAFFLDSVRAGRFRVGGLVTDRFAPTEAAAAYARLTEAHAETIGVLFGWRLE